MIIADIYRYGRLRRLLAAGKWKEADLETTKVMINITGKAELDEITPEDIQKFPCNDIMVIDQSFGENIVITILDLVSN